MRRGFRHIARGVVAAAAFGATLSRAAGAHAQLVLERFEPAERGSRFFVADTLELDGNLRFATGVVTSYGSRLRTFRERGDSERSSLIEHSLWLHPGASLVLAPGARFAIDTPVVLQSSNPVTLERTSFPQAGSPRLGDVRGSFDVRLAGSARSDVDGALLATGVSAYLPTGSGVDYTSDDFARVAVRVATAVRVGSFLGAARAGYMYRNDDKDRVGGVRIGPEVSLVVAAGYQHKGFVVGPELHGATTLGDFLARTSTPVEVLAGSHVSMGDIRIGAGIGTLVVAGLGAARVRGVVSIEWTPTPSAAGPSDRDRDGIDDRDDLCPDVPGPADSRGCPPAPQVPDESGT